MELSPQGQAATSPLPDYELPPVIEVACGIQFEPLSDFRLPLLGVFWERVRGQYPKTEEKSPIAPVVERFGDQPEPQGDDQPISLEMLPLPRIFFIDESDNWVMQLQRDRFLHNWRKVKDQDIYPHYPAISQRFLDAWASFTAFCKEYDVGEPKIVQLELTYINHIPFGEACTELTEVQAVFPDLSWNTKAFLPPPESLGWSLAFRLPNRQGRLRCSVRYGIRTADKRPVLLCELTARGLPPSRDTSALEQWFALGREWIVRGFADLTSQRIQKDIWRRKQ